MTDRGWLDDLATQLPRHAAVIDRLVELVRADERWRWLELCCSVAEGRADEWSDLDLGLGAGCEGEDDLPVEDAERLVRAVAEVGDLLVHRMADPRPHRRIAAEYVSGVQIDLVVMPALRREGLPPGSIALVDKDRILDHEWIPPAIAAPGADVMREWAFLGWWALSDAAKYLARGSVFEAADRIAEARRHALQLHAAAQGVDYPGFGLTSILDVPSPALPMWLEETFAEAEREPMRRAALAAMRLLRDSTTAVELALGVIVDPPLATLVSRRLEAL